MNLEEMSIVLMHSCSPLNCLPALRKNHHSIASAAMGATRASMAILRTDAALDVDEGADPLEVVPEVVPVIVALDLAAEESVEAVAEALVVDILSLVDVLAMEVVLVAEDVERVIPQTSSTSKVKSMFRTEQSVCSKSSASRVAGIYELLENRWYMRKELVAHLEG